MIGRRMSRIVKMGVCSALNCIRNTKVDIPDAIITGTGLGCLEDTEKFLGSVFTNEEKLLNPTPFIHSTHNTVASAIALAIKCHNYNITYTHRGFSFESALQDALMQLAENPETNIMVGGFDELTTNFYNITRRLGLWKEYPVNNLELKDYKGRGTLPGEGMAFFMLSGVGSTNDLARLRSVETFFKPRNYREIEDHLEQFLLDSSLKFNDVDLVLLGINGDTAADSIYYQLMDHGLKSKSGAYFKHLCGEYETASSFALWLAAMILKNQMVPEYILLNTRLPDRLKNIVIYNHVRGVNHVLYLLSRC
jgi:3-oxoacyl-(acyl-carrier-protein) synthase